MSTLNATARVLLTTGAAAAALAVILGAFGAHGLRDRLGPEMMAVYQTAVQYHFYHAIGLVLLGVLAVQLPSPLLRWSGAAMFAGLVLFCGSLYLLAVTGTRWLGAVAPVGGTGFIVAWLLLAVAILRS